MKLHSQLTNNRACQILIAIFLVAFVVRIAATIQFGGLSAPPSRTRFSDGVEFSLIANNLLTHHEFSVTKGELTSFRAPGFPFALAGVYAVTGLDNFLTAHLWWEPC